MSHLIDHAQAMHFIEHYQRLLVQVVAHPSFPKPSEKELDYYQSLVAARDWMLQHPQVLEDALAALRSEKTKGKATAARRKSVTSGPLPDDVEQAVRSLRADRWVYLRDTAHYSIFLPLNAHEQPLAYAVKSLTTRMRDMTGGSGLVLKTALMEYAGCIVTDGLLGTVAYLGGGYRESYGEYLAEARMQGHFYQKQLPAKAPAPTPAPAAVPPTAVKAQRKRSKTS